MALGGRQQLEGRTEISGKSVPHVCTMADAPLSWFFCAGGCRTLSLYMQSYPDEVELVCVPGLLG